MPGHKLGRGIPEEFLSEIEKLDITEIPGMDDLHNPSGILNEAQELAAQAFGASRSYFLVNGSTVGLHAAIAAVCRPGQRLIVGRDSHSSVINGMLLAGVRPYYVLPEYSEAFSICTGITPAGIKRALRQMPEAVGVLITRPNYYGVCCDIEKIAEIVHSHDKILIVDEAHGPHLVFNKRLPVSALEAGADICIQSAHKTLPAFTQGAYLHIGTHRVDIERLEYFLDMFQTTSPSYVIMAFLDMGRAVMQRHGTQLLDRLLDSIGACGCSLCSYERGPVMLDSASTPGFDHDPTRIVVNVSRLGITGYDAERLMRERYSVQSEMSDPANIVFISTVADGPTEIEILFSALEQFWKDYEAVSEGIGEMERKQGNLLNGNNADICSRMKAVYGFSVNNRLLENNTLESEPLYILNAKTERISLGDAVGRVSKGKIAPYPPGIALVCPGEIITHEAVDLLKVVIEAGGRVHGINSDGTVCIIAGEGKKDA
jgi:arginine decarboxylase